jgi:ACS family D-galactonate transporter-like MFS transporter
VTLIVICQSTQSLITGGVALFLPLIRGDLHLTFAQGGSLAAVANLTYAFMQVPSGFLADRLTPRRLFLVGLVGTNVLAMLFAVLTSYHLLLLNQALSGVFRALVFAPGLLLISNQFPPGGRATAMGLYVAGGFSSNVLLSSLGPVLVGPLGWHKLFFVFAASGLLVLVLFWRFGDDHSPAASPIRIRELPSLLRHPILWVTGFIQFVRLAVAQGFVFWLPSYVVVDRGYSLGVAGLVAALGALVTAPANFLGGYLSDRLNRPLTIIGTSVAVLCAGLAALTFVPGIVLLLVVVALISVFIQVYFGPLFAVPIQYLGATNAGVLSGFGNFCANLGGFAFAYALGAVKDATGSFRIGFLSLSLLAGMSLVATLLVRKVAPHPEERVVGVD